MGIIKVTPNKEQAKSIFKMCETTTNMLETIDSSKFPSNIIKEYYEILRELSSIILLLDGYKTKGQGAHKIIIDYIDGKNILNNSEISLFNELRDKRNKITYDGFFIKESYFKRKLPQIQKIISKLKSEIKL